MWPVLGIVAVYARELLLARNFWCQNIIRILEELIFGWRRSTGYPLSSMAEARRHSRSPETQPRPPGREAPGSGSGPDGRRQTEGAPHRPGVAAVGRRGRGGR